MRCNHRIAAHGMVSCIALWTLACSTGSRPFPILPRPDESDVVSADSLVVLYYHSTDCFACFGVLGNWMQIANQSQVHVWLALDDRPAPDTEAHIRRLRLPFRVGLVNLKDEHGKRPHSSVKEVLFIHGQPIDSGVVLLGSALSTLASRIENTQGHNSALPIGTSSPSTSRATDGAFTTIQGGGQ